MEIYEPKDFKVRVDRGGNLLFTSKMKDEEVVCEWPYKDKSRINPEPTHKLGDAKGWVVARHPNPRVAGRVAFVFELPYETRVRENKLMLLPKVGLLRSWTWCRESSVEQL